MISVQMGKPTWKFRALALAAVIQLGILATMVISQTRLLTTGREVVVAIVPVDPRDLFRGDYVTLAFSISTIPADRMDPDGMGKNQPLLVTLRRGIDGVWEASRASRSSPSLLDPNNEVLIKGKVTFDAPTRPTAQSNRPQTVRSVAIHYGLER